MLRRTTTVSKFVSITNNIMYNINNTIIYKVLPKSDNNYVKLVLYQNETCTLLMEFYCTLISQFQEDKGLLVFWATR